MALSTGRARRFVTLALGALMMVGLVSPTKASADYASTVPADSSTTVISRADAEEGTGFAKRPCVDRDANKDDHHGDDSTAATAEETEKGARKHARAKNHESAARAYEYAACLWDMISEFDKAEAAYEKAAAEYDAAAKKHEEAGDKVRAEEARKNAARIRDYLK